ncbi:MAG: ROK family transcriptional regulator [Spirochaetaceae bacterium]|nr:ROK family transcriptional regulator [Spirochaetaceae bacterium]
MSVKANAAGAASSLYRVLDYIRRYGPLAKKELQRHTGLSWGSISTYTARLLADEVIVEYAGPRGIHKGRNPSSYAVNRRKNWILGMDVQMNRLSAVVTALDSHLLYSAAVDLKNRDAAGVFKNIITLAELLFHKVKTPGEIKRIGFSMPGLINPKPGKPLSVYHFTGVFPGNMAELIKERFGVPAAVFHDPDCMLMTHFNSMPPEEYKMACAGNVVLIRWSYGIGSALLLNGKLYYGDHRAAGEIGHTIVDPSGPLCICGNRGCLEVYASFRAILEQVHAAMEEGRFDPAVYGQSGGPTRDALWAAYRQKDPLILSVVNRAVDYMVSAVINLVNILDPRMIIFEGEFATAPGECFDRLKAGVLNRIKGEPVTIRVLPWENSGAVGAAEMLVQEVFFETLRKDLRGAG